MTTNKKPFESVDEAQTRLAQAGYVASREIAVVSYLSGALQKPLLLEGPAGVGKTELAKCIAKATNRELVRLQCYEGLDETKALYEWEYAKQLLYTQLVRENLQDTLKGATSLLEAVERIGKQETAFFHERFLIERPLLRALRSEEPVVLLVDEIDRADPEFEAMLLEILSDFQVTIPELGTMKVKAKSKPIVILTSNASRELSEALRRRCLHLFVNYPSAQRELAIVQRHVPEAAEKLAKEVVSVVQSLRALDLKKSPSVAEAVDWARALVLLGAQALDGELVRTTLSTLAKHPEDSERIADHANQFIMKL